jgi:DNA-binding MarR family transcriptional regulator
MPAVKALDPAEEALWRALNRIMVALPRALDYDLVHATGLSLHEYAALLNLSEAENQELRMTDLAAATALSASRITRLVEELQKRRLVVKRRCTDDARGNVAALTPEGLKRLQAAYPEHLDSARRRVMDYIDPSLVKRMAEALSQVTDQLA